MNRVNSQWLCHDDSTINIVVVIIIIIVIVVIQATAKHVCCLLYVYSGSVTATAAAGTEDTQCFDGVIDVQ